MHSTIYKLAPKAQWAEAEARGQFTGAPIDHQDGYIHFSTAEQVEETAAKHFKGADDLLLIAVDPAKLGDLLKYEPSRGGALFPHLYGPLPLSAVLSVEELPLGEAGRHQFPEMNR
ncbi:DUF952 domain-containing protein [Pararhizobium haloflavum]|uniref:DUF952 domain-containing protein n=1 Tax=Pararhizobium haloflavum TaxID=2037914 RepID=UPI000C19D3AB|nr:DUF952 domain-containing protein [Pararhizobium haloflavum]